MLIPEIALTFQTVKDFMTDSVREFQFLIQECPKGSVMTSFKGYER